ncbi:MAG: SMC-Scp complex subunit ScpB, partial [Deltaproteobacteria bacterium]|nr:SMC-Scp complex subunit ScpB [Deltaproteobacteria bacterium]
MEHVDVADLIRFRTAAWEQLRRASTQLSRGHLRGTLEAIIFASNNPLQLRDLARQTRTKRQIVSDVLTELSVEYQPRGIQLIETHRGWMFLTNPKHAAPVREITGKKPVRMSRQQLETLAIIAYRQPVTRPEIDDVRGVDSGPVLRTLLDRDLVKVLGKKEEPGRPLLYGTSETFLELFSLRSLADMPTLREFTELTDASRSTYERKLGESAPAGAIQFDDEPDAPIDPTKPTQRELDAEARRVAEEAERAARAEAEAAALAVDAPPEEPAATGSESVEDSGGEADANDGLEEVESPESVGLAPESTTSLNGDDDDSDGDDDDDD